MALDLPASLGCFVLVQLHLDLGLGRNGLAWGGTACPLDQSGMCLAAQPGRRDRNSESISPVAVVFLESPPLFLVGVFMATPGLFHELKLLGRSDGGFRGQEDQYALGRSVVQVHPDELNLFQLAQDLAAKGLNGAIVIRL